MDVPTARPIESIAEDTFCIRCGYNLRGLRPDSLCPECGTSVGQSLRGDLLKYANPEWLDKLRLGASLKLWNIALGILLGIIGSILVGPLPAVITTLVSFVGACLGLWAAFLITTQEPRISLQEDTITLRTTIRVCAVAGFAAQFMSQGIELFNWPTVVATIAGICWLIGVVAWVGELIYFRRFAYRIPDPRLAKSTGTLIWLLPIGVGIVFSMSVVLAIVSPGAFHSWFGSSAPKPAGPSPRTVPIFAIGGCMVMVGVLVYFLAYVRLLTKYKAAFKEAAAQARLRSGASVAQGDPE